MLGGRPALVMAVTYPLPSALKVETPLLASYSPQLPYSGRLLNVSIRLLQRVSAHHAPV